MNKLNDFDYFLSNKNLGDNPGMLFWQISAIWQKELKKILEPKYNIIHSQFLILSNIYWLSLKNKEVTQILLSETTKIEPMNVSKILHTLIDKKLVIKENSKKDFRTKNIVLTEKGKRFTKKALIDVEKEETNFFNSLNNEETTEKIYANLSSFLKYKS